MPWYMWIIIGECVAIVTSVLHFALYLATGIYLCSRMELGPLLFGIYPLLMIFHLGFGTPWVRWVLIPIDVVLVGMQAWGLVQEVRTKGGDPDALWRRWTENNLGGLCDRAERWAARRGGGTRYPPSLKAILDDRMTRWRKMFVCPAPNGSRPKKGEYLCDYDSLFDRADFAVETTAVRPDLPLAWEKKPFFGGGRHVVFFDGRVEFVPEERFPALLQQVTEWIAGDKATSCGSETRSAVERRQPPAGESPA